MERIETLSKDLGKVAVSCPIFAMQLLVSVLGMGVSVAQLLRGMDPAVYLPITTSIIGYWLPAPRRPPAEEAALAEIAESVASVVGPRRSRQGSPRHGSPHHGSPRPGSPMQGSPRHSSHELHSDHATYHPAEPTYPPAARPADELARTNNYVA